MLKIWNLQLQENFKHVFSVATEHRLKRYCTIITLDCSWKFMHVCLNSISLSLFTHCANLQYCSPTSSIIITANPILSNDYKAVVKAAGCPEQNNLWLTPDNYFSNWYRRNHDVTMCMAKLSATFQFWSEEIVSLLLRNKNLLLIYIWWKGK